MPRAPETLKAEAAVRRALAAWPAAAPEEAALRAHLSTLAAADAQAFEHAEDVCLAFCAARNLPWAAPALNELLAAELPRALARFAQPRVFAAEVRQQLLEKLLVGDRARIRTYGGRGPLRPWLRSAAVRLGIDLLRQQRPHQPLELVEAPRAAEADPELAHLRRRFTGPLKAAVEAALHALPVDERNALRFYFLEGMTVEQIATLRGIHKSNVSRLIARIRRAVLEEVKRELTGKLGVAERELDSVMRLVQSQLQLSLERALSSSRRG